MLSAWTDPVYSSDTCWSCNRLYAPTKLEQRFCSRICKRAHAAYRGWRREGSPEYDHMYAYCGREELRKWGFRRAPFTTYPYKPYDFVKEIWLKSGWRYV